MKQLIKRSAARIIILTGLLFVFAQGTTTAQTAETVQKKQRFSQLDQNGDEVISRNEYSYRKFGNFDANGDQQLSRREFRKMNNAKNKGNKGNPGAIKQQQRLKDDSGSGQQKKGNSSGRGKQSAKLGSANPNCTGNARMSGRAGAGKRGRR